MLLQHHHSRVCHKKHKCRIKAHNALAQRVFKTAPLYAVTNPAETANPFIWTTFTAFFESLWSPATGTVAAAQKSGMTYVYDEDGTLIADTLTGGATTTWGQSAKYIYLPTASGPMPVAAIYGTKHYAIQSDHLNTPRRLIQSDGQVAWQWAYSAFGDEQPTIASNRFANADLNQSFGTTSVPAVTFNLRYPGQYFDQESNLHYNYHRSYSATVGRYTQADPIGLDGGWNRFGYVDADPLGFTDPFGLNKYVYKGRGIHHQLPSSVARDQNWSTVAIREFDNSGFNPPLHRKPHYREGDITHDKYNKEVNQFCSDWAKANKIDPRTATAEDAKKLMYDLRYNSTPIIMNFNKALWMRSMLTNTWWYRPTSE